MYHPTTRVLTILEMLQSQPGLSGAAIAKQLEVDRRTVRRYVAMLQELGIPIKTTRGPYGGYQLQPGFKVILRGQYDPLEWIAIQLLRFDCRVTVRTPAALVAILRVIAERAGAMAEVGHGGEQQ
jgi:biotin operon repressor